MRYRYRIEWKQEEMPASYAEKYADRKPSYEYSYGTRNMRLEFSTEKVELGFESSSLLGRKTLKDSVTDVLEKIYVLYTMLYSYGFQPEETDVTIEKYDGRKKKWEIVAADKPWLENSDLEADFLVEGPFVKGTKEFEQKTWLSDDYVKKYLSTRSSQFVFEQEKLKAALYAWIYSKTRKAAIERFQYLWIAYNSLYFHYGRVLRWRAYYEFPEEVRKYYRESKAKEIYVDDKLQNLSSKDENALTNFVTLMGVPTMKTERQTEVPTNIRIQYMGDKERKRLDNRYYGKLTHDAISETWDGRPVSRHSLAEEHLPLAKKICANIGVIDHIPEKAYRFLLTTFAYNYLRCSYFHGIKPILLFCPKDSADWKCLVLVSDLLEEILESYLFDSYVIDKDMSSKEEAQKRLMIITAGDQKQADKLFGNIAGNSVQSTIKKINLSDKPQQPAQTVQAEPL